MKTLFSAALFALALTSGASVAATVADGSFEDGTPNSFWNETSTNYGSPLCTIANCGVGTGTGPRTGDWWAWFGGVSGLEDGSTSQSVTIASGTNSLVFWFENIASGSTLDFLEARIDTIPVWTYFGGGSLSGILGYTEIQVNISAFADGNAHMLEFYSETGKGGTVTNFFIDDVSFQAVPLPATGLLLLGGLVGAGVVTRRRKRA